MFNGICWDDRDEKFKEKARHFYRHYLLKSEVATEAFGKLSFYDGSSFDATSILLLTKFDVVKINAVDSIAAFATALKTANSNVTQDVCSKRLAVRIARKNNGVKIPCTLNKVVTSTFDSYFKRTLIFFKRFCESFAGMSGPALIRVNAKRVRCIKEEISNGNREHTMCSAGTHRAMIQKCDGLHFKRLIIWLDWKRVWLVFESPSVFEWSTSCFWLMQSGSRCYLHWWKRRYSEACKPKYSSVNEAHYHWKHCSRLFRFGNRYACLYVERCLTQFDGSASKSQKLWSWMSRTWEAKTCRYKTVLDSFAILDKI